MKRVTNAAWSISLAAAALLVAGCVVPRAQWRAANEKAADYKDQLAQSQAKYAALKVESDKYDGQLATYEKQLAARREVEDILERRVENLKRETENLHAELTQTMMNSGAGRVIVASNRVNSPAREDVDLPPELSRAIAAIAGRYDGIGYDPTDKVIRFQTELLFVGGGDRLRPEARAALKELAEALNQPAGRKLIFQIVGHTWGEQQVTRDLLEQHPTDWHLAAHQALAFEDRLQASGVNPIRMGVVSYGSQQPLVNGNDDVAHRKNARVEIYFVPAAPLR